MKHSLTKRRTAVRILGTVCVVLLLHGCGGGGSCGRTEEAPSDDALTLPSVDVSSVLANPVEFDPVDVNDANKRLKNGKDLAEVDFAQIIVINEAAINHLMHKMEELTANDDAADTWNVFNELDEALWPAQTFENIELLQNYRLDDTMSRRVWEMGNSRDRIITLMDRLCSTYPRLKPFVDTTP